ncbi:hypothetical protein A3D42_00245 [Candidatus Nomurabacteria bacterium RIFCSPHIGHO2_02_FULL_41_18]|uniref:fructose-bisphosphate aldolase n=1 Tax=Candidatus Nomurabacteria bacterium RIFCSPHIGHO2_02_FULL_41_18 TaxID=1801754 RepID=A0A1F6W810_9BACT|nr:MAG: hypothetical protein A2737_02475 [Candidatus Nomurabacteria bacterium RIFCSPHIGHO2_01_FULL_41_71]OGI77932.1 MAG: hypothetical protein A3D42_00245 [Candidatus Nomurabacteria bacterium RIFCSPHIGHO2_02_FULL_41_18]OGI89576.1 MAG: hypothetical protein A3B01_00290 [Candidatus Nomurabacteria bacterium RIFCSPLOWO2_01_FULL_41_52b]OGJ00162.1 MAG: hypothetical protein A3I90_00160 [Candidatus Nomurabacteria bacterium RIFCSPLOWO2_02_FULL_41_9]
MNQEILINTVKKLITSPKGILAIDESLGTCRGRFEKLSVPFTEEKRREYRELLITAPGIEQYISGYILVDETAFQKTKAVVPFTDVLIKKGICVGITAYTGYAPFNGTEEKVTEGLNNFSDRIKEYKKLGASFSKWREMIRIGQNIPTENFLNENAKRMAEYALICQREEIVPFVEPEIMIDGDHSIEKCYEITARNLDVVFSELKSAGVYIPGIILKTSMVLSGKNAQNRADSGKVAEMTIRILKKHVPKDIGGIVFLSGGQTDEEAVNNLNAMNKIPNLPWRLTFSYGRAIQNPALQSWAKNPEDVSGAQKLLLEAARNNSLASIGEYK